MYTFKRNRTFRSGRFGLSRFGLTPLRRGIFRSDYEIFQKSYINAKSSRLIQSALPPSSYCRLPTVEAFYSKRTPFTVRNSSKRCLQGILLGIKFLVVVQSNWISGVSGVARVFDYDLWYCKIQAWLFGIFVAPHISLIMVVNVGSMRWALLLFKYFLSMSCLSHSCCRWPESKTIVRSKHSLDFARALLGLIRYSPNCSMQFGIWVFFNIIHIKSNDFFKAIDLHRAVFFNIFCTASPRSIVATHYTRDHHLKLDQTKCNTAGCIKNLLATSPKMVHDRLGSVPSEKCALNKWLFQCTCNCATT